MVDNSIIHRNPTDSNILSYLRQYKNAGFNILPLREKSKKPALKKYSHLRKQPLTLEKLEQIYSENPGLNIAVLTGPSSGGLCIVDVDHEAPEELVSLIFENPTVTVRTARGKHYYYRSKEKLKYQKFSWGEFRSAGVYTVIPPSTHPNGIQYEFLDGFGLDEIAELPKSILEFLNAQNNQVRALQNNLSPSNLIKPKLLRDKPEISTSGEFSSKLLGDSFRLTYHSPEIAFRVMERIGIKVSKFGESFKCPIHDEINPSCTLWQHQNGIIVMKEFHKGNKMNYEGKPNSFALPVVYASYISKRKEFIELTNSQMVIWWFRALFEIGEIKLPGIKYKSLPNKCPKPAKVVYEGLILLIRIRSYYDREYSDGTIFAWDFGACWCSYADKNSIKIGLKWLSDNGYIAKTKEAVKCGNREAAVYKLK